MATVHALHQLLAPLSGLDASRTAAFARDLTSLLDAPLNAPREPPNQPRRPGHA
jgi:MarR family transcriptional regulator, organic hydroperoxide resistance regulator